MHRRHKTALVVAAAAIMLAAGAVWCLPTSPAPAPTHRESPIMGNLLPPLSIDDYTWHEYGNEKVLSVTVSMTNYAVDEDLDIDTNPISYTLSTSPAINGFHTVVTSNWYSRIHRLKPGESISFGLSFATTEPLPPRFDFRIISPYGISNPHAATKPAGKEQKPQLP